ncbi:PREDICTED: uncharacterized protein LOC109244852 [Nicotiana attenuata]|uniref:uncharacterized protein LOC109244852 n=1 Tax=Nicotiana attenuata TaxID=49451 RepID=UPI0009049A85|nr:PREDICTED: uncharacterized protein LOC109244852 [Nicotiana attenuata]
MCENIARPKALFIVWLQQHDMLLTATKLKNWGIQVDTNYIMCKLVDESKDHLFAEYAIGIGRQVWSKLMNWLQIAWPAMSLWRHMQHWIEQHTQGKTNHGRLVKLVYAEFVYAIWIERNNRIFV